jgi:hypothetical protein
MVHHSVLVIHHGHMLIVYTVYLRAKIGVIYSTADAYAIGLFIDLRGGSVCMQSGSYFLNPREFLCFQYIPPFYSSQHIPTSLFRS